MKQPGMNASKLRAVLGTAIVLIIGLTGVGFYFAQEYLSKIALEVNNIVLTSTAGNGDSQSVSELQKAISDRQVAVTKANAIITPAGTYTEQIISDLNKIASQSGVTIANYAFANASATGATPDTTAKPTTTISGVQVKTATVTLGSPLSYTSLLEFIRLVETNLPKMQISGVTIARDAGSANSVTVQPLTIEVYTR